MKKSIAQGLCLVALSVFSVEAYADETTPAPQERTSVDSALKRDAAQLNVAAPAAPEAGVAARAGGGPIEAKTSRLGAAGAATTAQTNVGAGSSRAMAGPQVADPVMHPAARPQRGRRAAPKAEDPQRPILDAMNGSFASCLTAPDAAVEGTAVLNVSITSAGEVSTVATVTPGGVSPKAAACFREVLAHAKFAPVAEASVVQVRLVPRDLRAIASARTAVAQN